MIEGYWCMIDLPVVVCLPLVVLLHISAKCLSCNIPLISTNKPNQNVYYTSKAWVSCLKCMQLQMYAVVRQVYAVGVVHAVVASYNHLQLHLQLRLAETQHLQLHLQLLAWCSMQLHMQLWGGRITQLQLFGIRKVTVAIGNFSWKERTTPSMNCINKKGHWYWFSFSLPASVLYM